MKMRHAPAEFIFDARKCNEYLQIVSTAMPALMPKLEDLLDNGRALDGYRQVSKTIYNATFECIDSKDIWITKQVERGDGIGLRTILWNKMEGGNESQRTITAMQTPMNLNDIHYRFQQHGIDKYFDKVNAKIGKLNRIGRVMDKMSVLSAIFQHLGSQCTEYKTEADLLLKQFVKDKTSVTIKSAQLAFTNIETTHGLGVTSKGTPIPKTIPMVGPSGTQQQIPVNAAGFAGTKAGVAAAAVTTTMAEAATQSLQR